MMRMRARWALFGIGFVLLALCCMLVGVRTPFDSVPVADVKESGERPAPRPVAIASCDRCAKNGGCEDVREEAVAVEPEEDVEDRNVEAFDALTDRWMEPSASAGDLAEVQRFVAAFKAVPAMRQDECIHRALNLIPDENVMLLVGVLMDKSISREIVESVFNDVLNRNEDVKRPIMQQIYSDKTHSCWADTAWILDVTGELPKEEGRRTK